MKFKFPNLFLKSFLLTGASSLILAACTAGNDNSLNRENLISLSVPQIGSLNYLLEPVITKDDALNLLVEPLIKSEPTAPIRPFLTAKNRNVRLYKAADNITGLVNALDFDPTKITKDSEGFWDPTTNSGSDNFEGEGSTKHTALPRFVAGAADVVVTLVKEKPLYATTDNETLINNRVIRFHIRDDLYWSNGAKVTAEDYVSTMKYVLDPARGAVEYGRVVNFLQVKNASHCYNQRYALLTANPG